MRRKGNTVAEKLEQDRASLEALGLVVPGQANNPAPSAATPSTPSAPLIDVAVAATSSSAAAASAAAAPPSVELLARMVGEVSPHTLRGDQATGGSSSSKVQKKEDRIYSSILGGGGGGGGVGGAATASATSKVDSAGGVSGVVGTAGQQQQQTGIGGDPAADLISMDDLLEGWAEDEVPARWPSLTLSSERPGAVTVLCTGRLGRKQPWVAPAASSEEASGGASTATPAGGGVDAPATQQASDAGSNGGGSGGGGIGAPGQNEPEAVVVAAETTPGPKRLSFRRPSTSSLGVSKTVSRSQSSSSFTLPTRLGRWAPKPPPVQVEDAVAVEVVAGDDVANKVRSPSPPPPPPSSTMRPLASLLPDSRELRAPPPPPLPPPLPHKAEMWLVDPASPSSSSSFSGTAGGGGGHGLGAAGGGGTSTTTATMVGSLTSLPSFSSLLASAHGGRGGAAAHAASAANVSANAAGHGESASGAALGGSGGSGGGGGGGGSSVSTAAEMVGEPQHMDQLFDMLEVDLGIGGGREVGAGVPGKTRGDARRGRASVISHEVEAGAGVWGPGDGRDGPRSVEWGGGSARQGRGARPSAFGGRVEAAVDYNASLWHILQVSRLSSALLPRRVLSRGVRQRETATPPPLWTCLRYFCRGGCSWFCVFCFDRVW